LAALLLYNKKQPMAINVNTVYQTVLSIINKEQRGYITPDEFNKLGTQVQLEIFEKYFEDLNQQARVPQSNLNYANRLENIDEKIAIFKTFGNAVYNTASPTPTNYFTLPTQDAYGRTVELYRLGEVTHKNEILVQRLQRNDFYTSEKSKLTKATITFPTYLYENNFLFIKPDSILSDVEVEYVRKPSNVIWGFNVGTLGQYIFNELDYNQTTQPTGHVNFELHESEQTEVVLRILQYAGIIIRDPQIVQAAAQQVQMDEINKKS
tara:strand:- start:1629 stop:2423 length:795 start_codon:yes stop_codon:yes gene_type:complete